METLESFTEPLILELSANGSVISSKQKLSQPEKDIIESIKKDMKIRESRARALGNFLFQESKPANQPMKKDLKKEKETGCSDSSFVVAANGELYHRALPGLELNAIYKSAFKELSFGHGE